jgi:hypothetical protein
MNQPQVKVRKADFFGDGFYYTPEDLEWWSEPKGDDPGITRPKNGAIPRNKDGVPIAEESSGFDLADEIDNDTAEGYMLQAGLDPDKAREDYYLRMSPQKHGR